MALGHGGVEGFPASALAEIFYCVCPNLLASWPPLFISLAATITTTVWSNSLQQASRRRWAGGRSEVL